MMRHAKYNKVWPTQKRDININYLKDFQMTDSVDKDIKSTI